MKTLGIGCQHLDANFAVERSRQLSPQIESYLSTSDVEMLRIGGIHVEKRVAKNPEKIPNPLFHENAIQTQLLSDMLRTFSSGEAMLLIGNQGVGKNKLVDRLLQLVNAEREYIQLHRDTTVQSLTTIPNLVNGTICYDDSPLVRAAKEGTVIVIDEADKAPVEVVCLLKMLVEDGELLLHDGRRLLTRDRIASLKLALTDHEVIEIHEDFKLIALANRPGFPFHGNNFFRECGDVLVTHVIDNLDLASEIELLRAYGPDVPPEILSKLALSFADLRAAYNSGKLSYPFSAREAVAVVKHAQKFPQDGIGAAVEDFLGFEGATPKMRRILAEIFRDRGIPVPLESCRPDLRGINILDANIQLSIAQIMEDPVKLHISPSAFVPCPTSWTLQLYNSKTAVWNISDIFRSDYKMSSTRLNKFKYANEFFSCYWF